MTGTQTGTVVLAALCATLLFAPAASAGRYDGSWSMTAVTTKGHCGTIPMGMGVKGGRIYSTGGWFAFYPIRLGGRVTGGGHVTLKAIAGPRVAWGSGRFRGGQAGGKWHGKGPSGLCSGYWRATRG
jgi:hypothetical protein